VKRWLLAAPACALAVVSCATRPRAPAAGADLPALFAGAFREDASGDPGRAVERHLDVVRASARAGQDPWQTFALEASLDALVTRTMPLLGDAAPDAALANRTPASPEIARGLARAATEAAGPFARGLIARALLSMAERRGDADAAAAWRAASGCAPEAVVVGPLTWAAITGVAEPGPFDSPGARLQPVYSSGRSFDAEAIPVVVRGRGCAIDLSAQSARPGVREVLVDLDVPRAEEIGVALRAHGAATLRVAGAVVLTRPFELGDGEAARFARARVTPGALRLSVRVGTARDDDTIEIDAWGDDGEPLRASAPAIGSSAGGRALDVRAVTAPAPGRDEEALVTAAAAIAAGDAREAERWLWPAATRAGAPPELALVYGRAVESARDLSVATRAERARGAYERVLEVWPGSWEAAAAHAMFAGMRRGRDEAGLEVLRDLDAAREKARQPPPFLDAFDAVVSGRERLFDRAAAALDRARPALAGTALLADAEDAASPRTGAELVRAVCDDARPMARSTLACFNALRAAGDRARAASELARVRAVLGAPDRFLPLELRERLVAGDADAARRAYAAMLPAERTLSALASLEGDASVRQQLSRAAAGARDAPASIAPLLHAAGDDPAREFDGVAERLAAQDRTAPILESAATAVLEHVERYDVSASGLVRWILFDVRRVSGTTDVEENAQAAAPEVWGRAATRPVRRRIFKRDGRVLEPDPAPRASQAHADLSQLEQGDVVEAMYEGWALPGDTGDVGIDTPDLLPERVAVHAASVELRLPRSLGGSLWSHALLGRPTTTDQGDTRILSWRVADVPERRVEDAVPKMDRSVGVSYSTARWTDVAAALRETIASLGEHDPEIAAWARGAAGAAAAAGPTRATVEAIVGAAGRALREADPGTLSDYGGGLAGSQTRTARTFLTSHDGSRSWLVMRSLRELGVPCDLVVAENEPFSADAAFPPHFGRFAHPLVVAHVDGQDVWIDADVPGPPLPAGRVSPELRGRLALRADGSIAPLPAFGGADERSEIDVRLALDDRGGARGTFAVVLRGRDAQELSEAFFRIVGADRQRALRDVVLAWLPWANVDDVQLASSEGSWQVSLRAEVSVGGYAQLESKKSWRLPGLDTLHWSWPQARVSTLGATFATRAGRESALALNTAVQYHLHRRIELPRGARVARAPGPVDVRSKLVEATRSIGVDESGRIVEEDFVLGVATGTIPPADYDAFVAVAHAADDGFSAGARVTVP